MKELKRITKGEKEVAVAISSGLDSTAVMLGLLELKKKVTAYCFHVEDVISQDFIHAKKNCETFKVLFKEITLPKMVRKEIVIDIIKKYYRKKKTDIECIYPFIFLLRHMNEKILVTGSCSDGYFCISKRGMIHYRQTLKKIQEFRSKLFNKSEDYAQTRTLNNISSELYGIKTVTPFLSKDMYKYFHKKTWEQLNKPFQKYPIYNMFKKEFDKTKIFQHTNLQCGDSMIREMFEPLLKDEELNSNGRKRMMDLYRDIYFELHKLVQMEFEEKYENFYNRTSS